MKMNKILAMVVACFALVGCYEDFDSVPERQIFDDTSFEAQFPEARYITIAECKEIFTSAHGSISGTGENSGWNDTKYVQVEDDLYIKGKVVSDDEQGNVYKSLYIQDETSGIEIKLNNNVGVRFPYGTWVYVRLKDLYIGNYRMMLNIGGAPSESYNKAGEHKFYANSNIEIQSIIDRHVFPGGPAEIKVGTFEQWQANPAEVDVITVTKDNYKTVLAKENREMLFGRLMRFEDLKCHYAGVADQNGVVTPTMKSGSNENIYPSWIYTDPRPIVNKPWYRWAFRETDYTADGEEYATGRSLYGSVMFTYNDALLALDDSEASQTEAANYFCSDDGNFIVRTSGYSRFANRNICKDGEEATITAIYCIYSKESTYTGGRNDYALYQLTLNRYEDMVFTNGEAALLSDEDVERMTDDDMRYVPWMDAEGEIGE
ncbi:MAG: hypothetical protein E7133_00725 [Rikenellaceae bacterium]|nr:hypothetical protein [Rikenellaceae bacterium]